MVRFMREPFKNAPKTHMRFSNYSKTVIYTETINITQSVQFNQLLVEYQDQFQFLNPR